MDITRNLLTPNPMSRPQTPLTKVTKIAIHYVANPGSSAINNRNYFESLKNQKAVYASSHYIIGLQGEIIQCIPENEIAYCTNSANSYSISMENCHPDASGKFNDKTYASLIELCADICKRHGLNPKTDIIRHYDVTGKQCPLYYVKNPAEWDLFKTKVYTAYMILLNPTVENVTLPERLKKYISIDAPYWDNVLAGKEPASKEWLKILFERVLAALEQ